MHTYIHVYTCIYIHYITHLIGRWVDTSLSTVCTAAGFYVTFKAREAHIYIFRVVLHITFHITYSIAYFVL